MASLRRVYRAVAVYSEGTPRENVITRHFQSKRARDLWAKKRLEGFPWEPPLTGDPYDEGRPECPPADRVDVADSNPVTFPEADHG